MPLNGSGTYNPPNPPVFPAVPGTTIKASDFNAILTDMAAAISAMVARDGQSTITGVLQWAQPGLNLAALGGVALTGAQTIAGVKTFSSAPVSSAAAAAAHELMRKGEVDAAVAAAIPPGAVMAFAQSTAPTGWLKANGQLVSRTTYAALFAAIGTTYGAGDGSTTFALPDLRGEFVRGWDDGRGVDSGRSLGTARGSQGNTFTEFQTARNPLGEQSEGVTTVPANGDWSDWRRSGRSGDGDDNSIRFRNTGTEVLPRNIALLYCIKF